MGKTRLAIQVAEALKPNFPDGVWWVELAALKGEAPVQRRGTNYAPVENNEFEALDLVAQAAAKALRLPETPGQPLLEDLVENLREKHVLLVLDNCEHLTHASAVLINRLLGECPEVSILVTSREALRIPGERAWILPSLSLPDQADSSNIREIFLSEAVGLFIERTKEVSHNYSPGDLEAAIIAQICTRLDGIPLAIELAAARMNMLSAQEIASRLENRFGLLTGGIRSALPRHRTLQATIEWSFDLLSDPEKTIFRRLSVFAGGFTLEAGEAVSSDNEICSEEVLTLLGRLVDKSLLNVVPDFTNSGLATRYRFLDTILSFGRIKLEEAGETSTIRSRHAAYYVHLIEITVPELSLRNQGFWYRLLQAESDNIRAVIEWCVETDQAESALILAGALLWFWWSHGSAREGRDLTLKVLALPSSYRYKKYRGRALTTAAYSQWVLGANDLAKNLLEEALSLHKELGDEEGIAWSMQFLGLVFTSEGEYVLAAQAMKEGVAVARKLGDLTKSSFSLAFQGDIALEQGDINKAESIYKESASILRGLGNKLFLAYPLRHLGYLDLERRNFPSALEYFNESLMFNQEGNDQRAITACLVSYAALAYHLDKLIDAARICGVVESRLESLSINLLQADQVELKKIQSHLLAKHGFDCL